MNKKTLIALLAITLTALIAGGIFYLRNREDTLDGVNLDGVPISPSEQVTSTSSGDFVNESDEEMVMITNVPQSSTSVGFTFESFVHNENSSTTFDVATIEKRVAEIEVETRVVSSTEAVSINTDTDTDSDTIPDSAEPLFGTDPKKADTDGDTFPDADEIKNGYNPLGTGKCAVTTCLIN